MGSLVVPGPTTGPKGEPLPPQESVIPPFWTWFPDFLRDELRPYPGRYVLASRYVLAATLTMLVIVTFQLPGAAVGGFYSLLLPRDSTSATAKAAVAILTAFAVSLMLVVVGTMLFINYPLTHFLWVIGSFFLGFLALGVMTNYAAASAFTILIVLAVPAWDLPIPTAGIVVANLWVAGSILVSVVATLVVEAGFAMFSSTDQLKTGLADRLLAVREFLEQGAEGAVRLKTKERLQQLATVGVSRLRRLAGNSNASPGEVARRSTAVSLVGRLTDIVASLHQVESFTDQERPRLARLARQIRDVEGRLQGRDAAADEAEERPLQEERPLLLELERTAELLQLSFSKNAGRSLAADLAQPAEPPFFKSDAWSNPEHLRFALRGCLALMICYVVLNAVAWPGLGTSLFTVVVTSLSSIGSSRQKQLLRVSGALVGGVLFGIGSQVLILPMLDGIGGFTMMFVAVTSLAAWFITASPRISYFGTQMALAFFLIHLRGPFAQTNLAIARDNVMGIFLGLVVMWLVFESLGSKPAVVVMRELFAGNLKLMAELATPWPEGKKADLAHVRTLRDKISENFSAVNAQADGVLFEVGRGRGRSLKLRNTLLSWQPRFRSVFLLQIALLQYRVEVTPSELPASLLAAQVRLDAAVKAILEEMAESFHTRQESDHEARVREAFQDLRTAVTETYGDQQTPRTQAIVALSSHLVEGTVTLAGQLRQNAATI